MKVFFIGGIYEACYYVRSWLPMKANGWEGDRENLKERLPMDEVVNRMTKADVIIFHRPVRDEQVEAIKNLKSIGKKIVIDNDDTYIKDSGVPLQMLNRIHPKIEEEVADYDRVIKEAISIADAVTVSTEFLADEYRPYNSNVHVLKNCVKPLDWILSKPARSDNKIRLGIVGSVAANKDYESIIPLLDKIKDDDRFQLVMYSLPPITEGTKIAVKMYSPEFRFWETYKPEWHHFTPIYEYPAKLASLNLDAMLIPRAETYFNRCKSNIKFLEASMCGVPTIAQSFTTGDSPYEVNQQDAENMYLCRTEQDWIDTVLSMPDNIEEFREKGKKAKEYVTMSYDIKSNAYKWRDLYKSLWTTQE